MFRGSVAFFSGGDWSQRIFLYVKTITVNRKWRLWGGDDTSPEWHVLPGWLGLLPQPIPSIHPRLAAWDQGESLELVRHNLLGCPPRTIKTRISHRKSFSLTNLGGLEIESCSNDIPGFFNPSLEKGCSRNGLKKKKRKKIAFGLCELAYPFIQMWFRKRLWKWKLPESVVRGVVCSSN